MFDWFKPKCPISKDDKLWVESRLSWMADQFGLRSMLERKIILPTEDDFPEAFDGSDEYADMLFGRICGYMGVNRREVRFRTFDDPAQKLSGGGAAGVYSGRDIWVERAKLQDQAGLAAVIAHELCHHLLLDKSDASANDPDHEEVTDLATVFFGMGVISANSRMRTFQGGWATQGYLPTSLYGYALAVLAWARNERPPEWLRHLCTNARGTCKRSLKYFEKTRDCMFLPKGERIFTGLTGEDRNEIKRALAEAVKREDYSTAAEMKKLLNRLDEEEPN